MVNAENEKLTDYPVEVTVDRGFLSPNAETSAALVEDPAPAEGGLYGEWKSEGTSKSVTTDDAGDTGIVAGIEKDAGFDNSSSLNMTVTIKAGSVTKKVVVPFTSEAPLNPGAVEVAIEDADQSVSVLPKAPTSESVKLRVYATDQFGNLVDNETVTLSDSGSPAWFNGPQVSQLKSEPAGIIANSDVDTDQTISATWTSETNTYKDAAPTTAGFQESVVQGTKTVTDAADTIEWYDIDYDESTFWLTQLGNETQAVGDTATMKYTAEDQNGEPISGLDVRFFRSGPDDLQDGDGNSIDGTDQDGEAFYTFQGAKAGTAKVTAVPYEPTTSRRVPATASRRESAPTR